MRRSLPGLALLVLLLFASRFFQAGTRAVAPAPDFLRLDFPTAGLTVTEHGPARLEIFNQDWILWIDAADSAWGEGFLQVQRPIMARYTGTHVDVVAVPGGPTIHRFLRGVEGAGTARQFDFAIDFGGSWAIGRGASRDVDLFDTGPMDRFLRAIRLGDQPRPDREVLPAWRAYQARRKPGSPAAKFIVGMDPAPIWIGSLAATERDHGIFSDADFRRGGRQVAPDLLEFYSRDDPTSIRIDVWLDPRPVPERGERIFAGTLDLEGDSLHLWSFPPIFSLPIAAGKYGVTIDLFHRGHHEDKMLPEQERFDRESLERYEIRLERQAVP